MASSGVDFKPEPSGEDAALEWLLLEGQIGKEDVHQARTHRRDENVSLLITLNRMGVLSDDRMLAATSRFSGIPTHSETLSFEAQDDPPLSIEFMRDTHALLRSSAGPLFLVDPFDDRLLRAVEFALGHIPQRRLLSVGDWQRAFQASFPEQRDISELGDELDGAFAVELADSERDAPIVRQVAAWIAEAADLGASDIHFDARRGAFEVSYRVDGMLRHVARESRGICAPIISRIKVISGLDLGERNKAQDGRATIAIRGRRLDIRVSIIPTIDGESAAIRLLDRPDGLLSLEQLGFDEEIRSALHGIIEQRHGMFVVAGPTGSGKTTTLYACIELLRGRGLKILSVEDPVEYHFDHVNQVQISEKAGRSFANALRAFLRHDPDVILVGEIRDPETAVIAVQAALSGHLVFATIHAIDTSRVRTRLKDMGIEAFKLDACLLGAMSQRLVRRLCPHCAIGVDLTDAQKELFVAHGLEPPKRAAGARACAACNSDGFVGRIALADLAIGADAPDPKALGRAALELAARGDVAFSDVVGLVST